MSFARRHWPWIAAALILAAVHLTSVSSELGGNLGGDNIVYFLLGKAIANGDGYVDLYLPGNPVHRKYPFLFPLLLAPFHLAFDRPLAPMHVMIVCFWVAAFILFGLFLQRRLGDRRQAIALALMAGLIPRFYLQGSHLLSEAPFIAFVYAALLLAAGGPARPAAVEKKTSGKKVRPGSPAAGKAAAGKAAVVSPAAPSVLGWPRLAGLIVLSLLADFTRTFALALGAAVAVQLWRERLRARIFRPVPAWLCFAAAFGAGFLAWWAFAHGDRGFTYFSEFMSSNPYNTAAGALSASDMGFRLFSNLVYYLPRLGTFSVPAFDLLSSHPIPMLIVGGLGSLTIFFGLGRELRRRGGAAEWFFLLSLAIILLWPFQEDRFILPIIPLGMFYAFSALEWAANRLVPARRATALAAVFFVLLVPELFSTGRYIFLRLRPNLHPHGAVRVTGFGVWNIPVVDWSKYDLDYVNGTKSERENLDTMTNYLIMNYVLASITPADAVILSRKPMITYYYSHRKSVPILPNPDPRAQWEYIQRWRVDYLVTGMDESALGALFDQAPDRFRLVAEINDLVSIVQIVDRDRPLESPK